MIGKKVSHYEILDWIGSGGMAVVYKAHDTRLDRIVALKFLPPDRLHSEEQKKRFQLEAKAAASLDHPNVCTVYEIDEIEGQAFIAMAFIDGPTLTERIRERPLPLDDLLDLAIQIGDGLKAAHNKGIIHRDIKPANVILTASGIAKITDFGLARHVEQTQLTQEGTVLGTVAYLSPEQARGRSLDVRTDIWSFGVLLYEMITGRLPFTGSVPDAIIHAILNLDPEPITGLRTNLPVMLERVVTKALRKDPDERYQHIDEMLVDLREIQRTSLPGPPRILPSTPLEVGGRRGRRKSLVAWIGGFMVSVMIVYQVAAYLSRDREPEHVLSIAVFPFENSRREAQLDWLSEEMARTLSYQLSLLDSLRVIDQLQILKALNKTQALHAGLSGQPLTERSLGGVEAAMAIVGSYAVYGDSLRLLASLVEVRSGISVPLLERSYPAADFLGMQKDAARRITDRVRFLPKTTPNRQ